MIIAYLGGIALILALLLVFLYYIFYQRLRH